MTENGKEARMTTGMWKYANGETMEMMEGEEKKNFRQVLIKNCFGCTFVKCFSVTDLIQRS